MWPIKVERKLNELLACRGCLATDVKLYNIHENRLVEPYEELVGFPLLSSDHYPQHLCSFCRCHLFKFLSFRATCRKAQEVLRDAELAGKCITTQNLRLIDRNYFKLTSSYKLRKTETTDYIDDKKPDDVKQEEWINDFIDDDNEFYLSDHKIEIDIVNKEENDSELEEPIRIFVEEEDDDTPISKIKRKKLKKVDCKKRKRKREDDTSHTSKRETRSAKKNIGGSTRERSDEEIKEYAKSLDFDTIFLSKEEQMREVEERKLADMNDSLIIKCEICGKNFRDQNTANTHYRNYHDPKIGKYICEICSCRYKTNNRLLGHLRIHKVKFCCKSCNFISKIKCNLIRHYNWHQGKRQACPYCERVFEKMSSYFSHVRLKHAAQLTWCDLCGESFIGEKGVKAHQKRAHKDIENSIYKCSSCNTKFINKSALERHEMAQRCDLCNCIKCGECFVSEQLLKYHLVQHHTREDSGVLNHQCATCKVTFQNSTALKRHDIECIKGGYPCVQCGVSCDSEGMLNDHMIENHTLEQTFKCEECNKTFSNAYYFRDHYSKIHLNSENTNEKNPMGIPRRDRQEREPVKNKTRKSPKFKNRAGKGEMDQSVRKWRVVGDEAGDVVMEKAGPFAATREPSGAMCEVCGKSFMNSGLLKYHQRIHSGERPFPCTLCTKRFTVKTMLMQHMRVHTGERPYNCKHCPKAFKSASALYRHNIIHTGIRRHVCQLCDKTFQTSSCVKLHIKTVHMKLPMPPRNRRRNRVKDE